MKQLRIYSIVFLFPLYSGITHSYSQTFVATTPCTESVKKILSIPLTDKSEMMIWEITLNHEPENYSPTDFHLICKYGLAKPRSLHLQDGATIIEWKGKWTIGKGILGNEKAVVYNLIVDGSNIPISFYWPSPNLLHLLSEDKSLMTGTAAWNYTFNRKDPMPSSSNKFAPNAVSSLITKSEPDTIGTFNGRIPCNKAFRDVNNIPENNCGIIKCQLTLLQNGTTHKPTTFLLQAIYVGNGDNNKYPVTGKWKLVQGIKNDPAAIVYQLIPDKTGIPLLFFKADENVLFFLDNNTDLLVGNDYSSYTLSRSGK